jgi:predicted MFS family arabinose efflux permease
MREVIRLFVQIALLRRGPQDLPASGFLLVLTVIGYMVVVVVISSLLPPASGWSMPLLVYVLFTLAWYVGMLRLLGRPERTVQTVTAVFGLQAVVSPPMIVSQWLMRRFGQDSDWQLPIAVSVLVLGIWLIAALSHVVKAALGWSTAASVALVILQLAAAQLLAIAVFPAVAPGG